MADAKKSVDMKIVRAKEAELEEGDSGEEDSKIQKMVMQIKGMEGPMQIQMNTAALENKASALQILKELATTLGPIFFDHVENLANFYVSDLIHDKVSSMVRKTATKTLSVLLACCTDQTQMKALLNLYLPGFAQQIKLRLDSNDFRSVKWLVQELSRCFKHFYSWSSTHAL